MERITVGLVGLGIVGSGFYSLLKHNGDHFASKMGTSVEITKVAEIDTANQKIRAFNAAAIACYSVAGAALTTYLIWRFWPSRRLRVAATSLPHPNLMIGGAF